MRYFAATDRGRVRALNEDDVFASSEPCGIFPNLFLLADGMGGHRAGDYASQYTVKKLSEFITASRRGEPAVILSEGIKKVNRDLFYRSKTRAELEGMGTTLVAAVLVGSVLCVANVGDSRLYLIRNGLKQITKDHSWVEEMVSEGRISRDSVIYRQNRNIITRAVGTYEDVTPDFFEVELKTGDLVLLCSDGLTDMISEREIERIIAESRDLKSACEALIEAGNAAGGRDNISVILADPELKEVDTWC